MLLEEHSEAVEYDLIVLGLRLRQLGTSELSWSDLKAIVRYTPPGSALSRAAQPEEDCWQLSQHLMADMADSLRWLVWSKTKAAQDNRDMPEKIPRPGLQPTHERIGTADDIDSLNDFLGWDA